MAQDLALGQFLPPSHPGQQVHSPWTVGARQSRACKGVSLIATEASPVDGAAAAGIQPWARAPWPEVSLSPQPLEAKLPASVLFRQKLCASLPLDPLGSQVGVSRSFLAKEEEEVGDGSQVWLSGVGQACVRAARAPRRTRDCEMSEYPLSFRQIKMPTGRRSSGLLEFSLVRGEGSGARGAADQQAESPVSLRSVGEPSRLQACF